MKGALTLTFQRTQPKIKYNGELLDVDVVICFHASRGSGDNLKWRCPDRGEPLYAINGRIC